MVVVIIVKRLIFQVEKLLQLVELKVALELAVVVAQTIYAERFLLPEVISKH